MADSNSYFSSSRSYIDRSDTDFLGSSSNSFYNCTSSPRFYDFDDLNEEFYDAESVEIDLKQLRANLKCRELTNKQCSTTNNLSTSSTNYSFNSTFYNSQLHKPANEANVCGFDFDFDVEIDPKRSLAIPKFQEPVSKQYPTKNDLSIKSTNYSFNSTFYNSQLHKPSSSASLCGFDFDFSPTTTTSNETPINKSSSSSLIVPDRPAVTPAIVDNHLLSKPPIVNEEKKVCIKDERIKPAIISPVTSAYDNKPKKQLQFNKKVDLSNQKAISKSIADKLRAKLKTNSFIDRPLPFHMNYQQMTNLQLKRSTIKDWCDLIEMKPVILNSYLRLKLEFYGSKSYYLACVLELKDQEAYEVDGKTTTKHLIVEDACHIRRIIKIDRISDETLMEGEFNNWLKENGGRFLNREEYNEKKHAIYNAQQKWSTSNKINKQFSKPSISKNLHGQSYTSKLPSSSNEKTKHKIASTACPPILLKISKSSFHKSEENTKSNSKTPAKINKLHLHQKISDTSHNMSGSVNQIDVASVKKNDIKSIGNTETIRPPIEQKVKKQNLMKKRIRISSSSSSEDEKLGPILNKASKPSVVIEKTKHKIISSTFSPMLKISKSSLYTGEDNLKSSSKTPTQVNKLHLHQKTLDKSRDMNDSSNKIDNIETNQTSTKQKVEKKKPKRKRIIISSSSDESEKESVSSKVSRSSVVTEKTKPKTIPKSSLYTGEDNLKSSPKTPVQINKCNEGLINSDSLLSKDKLLILIKQAQLRLEARDTRSLEKKLMKIEKHLYQETSDESHNTTGGAKQIDLTTGKKDDIKSIDNTQTNSTSIKRKNENHNSKRKRIRISSSGDESDKTESISSRTSRSSAKIEKTRHKKISSPCMPKLLKITESSLYSSEENLNSSLKIPVKTIKSCDEGSINSDSSLSKDKLLILIKQAKLRLDAKDTRSLEKKLIKIEKHLYQEALDKSQNMTGGVDEIDFASVKRNGIELNGKKEEKEKIRASTSYRAYLKAKFRP